MNQYKPKRTYMGQLPNGSDLHDELTKIVQRENFHLGRIQGIGATTHAKIAYYDQNIKQYLPMEFPGGMEILNLNGNISMRDGTPFVHVHILLGDREGKIFGGHLLPGTKLFACEVFIEEYEGEELVRTKDEKTGLFLWEKGVLS
ncbi:MAG: PPC domain-containing DNA-binding protein [Bacteroidota bacterium]